MSRKDTKARKLWELILGSSFQEAPECLRERFEDRDLNGRAVLFTIKACLPQFSSVIFPGEWELGYICECVFLYVPNL